MTVNPLKAADFYHTGIVVPDLEAAKVRMSELAGYRWTTTLVTEVPVRIGDEDRTLEMRYVYSLDAPRIELVQEVPGTLWEATPRLATHHLGYFCDDLAATSKLLEEAGFEREVCAVIDGVAPSIFAFHVSLDGVRIEIVDRTRIPDLAEYLRERTPK
ncbi:VOC family protein [Nocardia sp. CA2R105]|uniref:VOC family protein n=1 Tax=Nocardia coffeae TaxID=2873381 RepID=UPI001CA6D923|nr:VOC family protein [Nocardia coffeae]MBY8860993.1 VOC family protein [Nocardia coffeae]